MTDTIIDDDIIEVTKPTTSGSNSSISTSRRPMFIETEVRTDTVTRRRVGSSNTAAGRNVYDVLQNTKSPTDGMRPTTYTYAHSVSYMPVTQNGTYGVPVMARRDLHGENHPYASTSFSSAHPSLSSPGRFISNVKSQLVNSYSAIRDRFTHQQDDQGSSNLLNSPLSQNGNRFSQTTTTNSSTHRRPTPNHSTPRDTGSKMHDRPTRSKQRRSQDDREDDQLEQDHYRGEEEKGTKEEEDDKDSFLVRVIKRILHFPLDVFSFLWHKLFSLPWWLLIPLLLFLGLYAFPHLLCRPFEHYPESKIYQNCRRFQDYVDDVTHNTTKFLRRNTYNRGFGLVKQGYHSVVNVKDAIWNRLDDVYVRVRKFFRRSTEDLKETVNHTIQDTSQTVQKYCDEGINRVHKLVDDTKREIAKISGSGSKLAKGPELEALIRQVIDEYAADETGQADYALEANGGKIVDTRCTEYTDEPRQNVVKFLGIPIVHMSKQPNIMIKAGRMPGQCFPFKGDQGSVVIKLAVPVRPTEFTLEHLSKNISVVGHINSAPRNFKVYALKDKNDKEGTILGQYIYDAEKGPSVQRFKPQPTHIPVVEYLELRVTSNWGNPNYTCVYRFRVHGDLRSIHQPSAPPAA